VVLEIDVEWVHHHRLQLVELLLELHQLVLPLDQSPSMIVTMNLLENLVLLLLLMMVDLDCFCHPELELEPHEASLHRSPF
jgi:hypothetical protein